MATPSKKGDARGVQMAERNMYECLPCPECGSAYRWPTRHAHPTNPDTIVCDDCGFKEPIDEETRLLLSSE